LALCLLRHGPDLTGALVCSSAAATPLHTGLDRQVKVWDVRTFQPLHAYFANSPATALDISQRKLLAVGQGRRLQVCTC
jgi:hypothetical protein